MDSLFSRVQKNPLGRDTKANPFFFSHFFFRTSRNIGEMKEEKSSCSKWKKKGGGGNERVYSGSDEGKDLERVS